MKIKDLLQGLKDSLDPNYWASKIGEKSGAYDKARNSKLRKWALNLKGWKWWAWQIIIGVGILVIIEIGLNYIGITILPWR